MRGDRQLRLKIRQQPSGTFFVPSIGLAELWYGVMNASAPPALVARLRAVDIPVLEFDHDDARCAGEVRSLLRQAGQPIGAYDVLIAGQALARDLTLVTHNVREFSRVPNLRIEDWEA